MEFTLTAKVQLLVSKEQGALLDKTMERYRQACNCVADYVFQTHDLKPYSIQKVLYKEIRKRFELKAQMAISVIRTVVARYKTILENQHEWIKPKFSRPQLDLVWNRDYLLTKEIFSVGTLEKRVKFHSTSREWKSTLTRRCTSSVQQNLSNERIATSCTFP